MPPSLAPSSFTRQPLHLCLPPSLFFFSFSSPLTIKKNPNSRLLLQTLCWQPPSPFIINSPSPFITKPTSSSSLPSPFTTFKKNSAAPLPSQKHSSRSPSLKNLNLTASPSNSRFLSILHLSSHSLSLIDKPTAACLLSGRNPHAQICLVLPVAEVTNSA